MDIMQLKYFKALAEAENMTKAANAMHVAQPALSRTLRNLEQELDLLLFDRVGKYISLNDNGRILLKHTDIILKELEDAEKELKEQKEIASQNVSLSVHAGSRFLADLIRGFKQRYPDITLQITQQTTEEGISDKCDIAVYSSIHPASGEHTRTLMEEEICLAMPSANPPSELKSVRLSDVAHEPLISLHKGRGLRTVIDEYCKMAGFEPNFVLESDSPSTIYDLTAVGFGLSFIPRISWQGIDENDAVKLVHISEPRCTRYVNMAWHSSRYVSRASILMRKYLIDFFTQTSKKYTEKYASEKK